MFTHVNLIMSERMADKPQFLADLSAIVNGRLRTREFRGCFVRAIYNGQAGREHFAKLTVNALTWDVQDQVRNLITVACNEFFLADGDFLHYSFALGDRVLAAK